MIQSLGDIFIQLLFVGSVFLIWAMLLYQFILTLAGYLYSRAASREKRRLDAVRLETPSVSILIPAHNEELVIERTLQSIFASDFPREKMEVIVIDDASTDKTAGMLDSLARRHAGMRVLHIPAGEGGKGKAAALNRGL